VQRLGHPFHGILKIGCEFISLGLRDHMVVFRAADHSAYDVASLAGFAFLLFARLLLAFPFAGGYEPNAGQTHIDRRALRLRLKTDLTHSRKVVFGCRETD
jgi:hypothetical protein